MQAVAAPQQLGQFVEIQVDQEQAVAKLVLGGSRASMADVSFVEATQHDSNCFPKHLPTASALLTPSS